MHKARIAALEGIGGIVFDIVAAVFQHPAFDVKRAVGAHAEGLAAFLLRRQAAIDIILRGEKVHVGGNGAGRRDDFIGSVVIAPRLQRLLLLVFRRYGDDKRNQFLIEPQIDEKLVALVVTILSGGKDSDVGRAIITSIKSSRRPAPFSHFP